MTLEEWEAKAKGLLKAEIKKKNLNYQQVVDAMQAMGVSETERNFRNKIGRGKFTAVFMLQVMEAIGCRSLSLD